ncbi:rhomboid family protein [Pedosphaera parvula]|nr:rhomboid family intramembrane serine protease [Pedosphaera parvula]
MHDSIFTYSIIGITVWTTIYAFRNSSLEEKLIFCPRYILAEKQYHRLVTSAFLHANWRHLFFNMFGLYAFGRLIESIHGPLMFLSIYFAGIIGGDLLALWLHRNHEYRAYGASGGVCGIVFAAIFLFPGIGVSMMFIPISIPGWLYVVIFLTSEFHGTIKGKDNVGHDAHLGGAIISLATATAFKPEIVQWSPKLYAAVMLLSLGMLAYLIKNPLFLPLKTFMHFGSVSVPKKLQVPSSPAQETERVNKILDKISQKRIKSLNKEEHELLLRASRKSQSK